MELSAEIGRNEIMQVGVHIFSRQEGQSTKVFQGLEILRVNALLQEPLSIIGHVLVGMSDHLSDPAELPHLKIRSGPPLHLFKVMQMLPSFPPAWNKQPKTTV